MMIGKILPGTKKNVSLKRYTTFKIGGLAKYFYVAKNKEDITWAIKAAKKLNMQYFILGEGSNMLVSDRGFNGLIIKLENCNLKIPVFRRSGKVCKVYAEAGVPFATLVRETGKRGLSGLEWAGGLPGTLGGAIRGNAGAFGGETKDRIIYVEALDNNLKLKKLPKSKCDFGYRSSIFKKRGWIVLSAAMRLEKGDRKKIEAMARDRIRYRKEKGPLAWPSAGSIFKNCTLPAAPAKTREKFKNVIKSDPFPVIPAAAILADAGLKGFRIGGAMVSPKHPNFIINIGGAKAEDVLKLTNFIKKKIKSKYGISLEMEIQPLGF